MIFNGISKETIFNVFKKIDNDFDTRSYFEQLSYDRAILKIQTLFKLGYVPSREDTTYKNPKTCNCIGHAVCNLDNDLLEAILKGEEESLLFNLDSEIDSNKDITKAFVGLVKSFGLQIKQCSPKTTPKDNQWKIGMYSFRTYYHFILQKPKKQWEEKPGWFLNERILECDKLPKRNNGFFRDKTFLITNPYYSMETT